MKRLLLNVLLCATLFVGCTDVALDHDSLEEFIQENNIPSSQILYYTTNDGSIVHIDDYIGDAKVIANRYENGRGTIVCDRTITSIGNSAFYDCDGLTNITIPNSVTSIGDSAFRNCDGPKSITIPNSVTSIGDCAFQRYSGLTSITIGNSVTSIGKSAFSDCDDLTSITIPNCVTSIGEVAFGWCDGLTSVTIGNSVTSIGNCAFYECVGLTSVYCKATTPPTLVDRFVFGYNGSSRKIYVPTASVSAYKSASGWSSYASSIVGYDF